MIVQETDEQRIRTHHNSSNASKVSGISNPTLGVNMEANSTVNAFVRREFEPFSLAIAIRILDGNEVAVWTRRICQCQSVKTIRGASRDKRIQRRERPDEVCILRMER